jgi:hypothetical protein
MFLTSELAVIYGIPIDLPSLMDLTFDSLHFFYFSLFIIFQRKSALNCEIHTVPETIIKYCSF